MYTIWENYVYITQQSKYVNAPEIQYHTNLEVPVVLCLSSSHIKKVMLQLPWNKAARAKREVRKEWNTTNWQCASDLMTYTPAFHKPLLFHLLSTYVCIALFVRLNEYLPSMKFDRNFTNI